MENETDKKELQTTILSYMEGCHSLSLATEGAGLPHAAAVFYVNIGFDVYFLSSPLSRHGMDISQNPRVSATINEDYADWRQIKGIQMDGLVTGVGSIWENGKIALRFIKKFPDVAKFFSSPQQLGEVIFSKVEGVQFYKLTPYRIFFINNEEGFGHKEELIFGKDK